VADMMVAVADGANQKWQGVRVTCAPSNGAHSRFAVAPLQVEIWQSRSLPLPHPQSLPSQLACQPVSEMTSFEPVVRVPQAVFWKSKLVVCRAGWTSGLTLSSGRH
jgi:hypothetical protein